MIGSGGFSNKKILLVDREEKKQNDRTWCFWETKPGLFESIVYKQWARVWFHSDDFSRLLQLKPYTYKLIRGIDFYNYCLDLVRQQDNIDILQGEIEEVYSEEDGTYVVVGGKKISGDYIFSSILPAQLELRKKDHYLLQHFKGWMIETSTPVFQPTEATLMDFRASQEHGCAFAYVMPFSATQALVEFTLFTEKLLQPAQYEEGLKEYIDRFITRDSYRIKEEENGAIPMTSYRFPVRHHNIIYTGTAGGQTKASSGYTFRFIQKHSAAIVSQLIQSDTPFISGSAYRFRFYDSVLLHLLHYRNQLGKTIFTGLFKKNKPQQVLRFLDNESSVKDELKIISSLPVRPFMQAALQHL